MNYVRLRRRRGDRAHPRGRDRRPRLPRPAVQHGDGWQTREQLRREAAFTDGSEDGAGDRTGFAASSLRRRSSLGSRSFEDAYDDYARLPRAVPRRGAVGCSRPRAASTCTSTTARCTTPRYCRTGSSVASTSATRSSGPTTSARGSKRRLICETRRRAVVREGRREQPLQSREQRAHPLHGVGYLKPARMNACARQAADRHLVAHDLRFLDGQGEARLPDAEAARRPRTDRARLLAAGRAGGGLPTRWQRNDGFYGAAPRPPLRPRRQLARAPHAGLMRRSRHRVQGAEFLGCEGIEPADLPDRWSYDSPQGPRCKARSMKTGISTRWA